MKNKRSNGLKITSTFAEIRWSGTYRSLTQILSNWSTLSYSSKSLFGRNGKSDLQELKKLIEPFFKFQVEMQTRSTVKQVACIIGMFRLWGHLSQPWKGGLKQMAIDIKGALKTRYFQKYLQLPSNRWNDLILERCLLMSPQYRHPSVIRGWIKGSGLMNDTVVDDHFREIRYHPFVLFKA